MTRHAYTLGCDLGQTNDYTALAVLERIDATPPPGVVWGPVPTTLGDVLVLDHVRHDACTRDATLIFLAHQHVSLDVLR